MYVEQKDLEQAIANDYRTLENAVKRLESRVYMYRGYSKSAQATCDADDAIHKIKQEVRKLEIALIKNVNRRINI